MSVCAKNNHSSREKTFTSHPRELRRTCLQSNLSEHTITAVHFEASSDPLRLWLVDHVKAVLLFVVRNVLNTEYDEQAAARTMPFQ